MVVEILDQVEMRRWLNDGRSIKVYIEPSDLGTHSLAGHFSLLRGVRWIGIPIIVQSALCSKTLGSDLKSPLFPSRDMLPSIDVSGLYGSRRMIHVSCFFGVDE